MDSVFVYFGATYVFERVSIPSCLEKRHSISITTAEAFLPADFIELVQKEDTNFRSIFPLTKLKGEREFIRELNLTCLFIAMNGIPKCLMLQHP